MSAWETTLEDVQTVVERHELSLSDDQIEEIHEGLDHDAIENGVLCYTDMDEQTDSMLDDIENYMISNGILPEGTEKKFEAP